MSNTVDLDGDLLIDLGERQFTLTEAAYLARVPAKSIRNWMARGQISIGRKNRIAGRWMFSMDDLLRLTVMHDLSTRMVFNPLDAATVAETVVTVARKSTARANPKRGLEWVLVCWTEDGRMVGTTHPMSEPGHYYPPVHSDGDYQPLRHSHVAIPATSLLIDMMLRTESLSKENARQERPENV